MDRNEIAYILGNNWMYKVKLLDFNGGFVHLLDIAL